MKKHIKTHHHPEGPLTKKALYTLSVYSAFFFVFAVLFAQFLYTLITAVLLKYFSIQFEYSPFAINFLTESSAVWSKPKIYLVFGAAPILITLLGWLLSWWIRLLGKASWRIKLSLTWTSFVMANALPVSLMAGSLFYKNFGIAFQWILLSGVVRVVVAIVGLMLMLLTTQSWQKSFMKSSYTTVFFDHHDKQRIYLRHVMILPWFLGCLALLPFTIPFDDWYWLLSAFSLGYISIPYLFHQTGKARNLKIMRNEKTIFRSPFEWMALTGITLLFLVIHFLTQ